MFNVEHYGIRQRWHVVSSEASRQKSVKKIEKKAKKERVKIQKAIFHLQADRFHCVEDAIKAGEKLASRWKTHSLSSYEIIEHKHFKMLEQKESIDMVDTYSAGFKKEIFLDLGGFDTRFPKANNEDTEFSYRMAVRGYTMVFTPRALVRHLNHPDSVFRYFRLKFGRGFWRVMVYRLHPKKIGKDSYTPRTLGSQIVGLFLIGLSVCFLLGSTSWPSPFSFFALISLSCSCLFFFLQTTPFIVLALKHDWAVTFLSPLLLALRAAAIGSGALWGIIQLLLTAGKKFFAKKRQG
ncbi:MAG: hypothetical protein D3917_17875 [Candidatus Electrothrix sp. AX5]|nr:hypothetical protein [Candidatus Electrothrix sp. AX5]